MDKFWEFVDGTLYFFIVKLLRLKLKEENWEKLRQFVKFGIVGVSNTLISYVTYAILVALGVHYLIASLAGFIVSVMNAYYWNDRYVFQTSNSEKRVWWKVFFKTVAAYAGTGLILNNMLLILWVEVVKIPEMIGPIINLLITVPLNFLLNKYWAFKKK